PYAHSSLRLDPSDSTVPRRAPPSDRRGSPPSEATPPRPVRPCPFLCGREEKSRRDTPRSDFAVRPPSDSVQTRAADLVECRVRSRTLHRAIHQRPHFLGLRPT